MTTTALRFQPIFINDRLYGMGLESLGFCLKKYETILGAFVFMPNHWHGVLWREGGFYLSGFMRDFKRFTSVQIRRELVKVGRADGFELGVNESDRKSYKIWQHRFDVVAINTPQVLETKINYIHRNPVKKGLVKQPEDWPYSSARFYASEENVGVPVSWIG